MPALLAVAVYSCLLPRLLIIDVHICSCVSPSLSMYSLPLPRILSMATKGSAAALLCTVFDIRSDDYNMIACLIDYSRNVFNNSSNMSVRGRNRNYHFRPRLNIRQPKAIENLVSAEYSNTFCTIGRMSPIQRKIGIIDSKLDFFWT
jgi:hypothetical protein